MMKLKDKDTQPAMAGLPESHREWWDLGDGYEIYVSQGSKVCSFWIDGPDKKDITYEIAKLLGLNVSEKQLITRYKGGDELYASMSINCVAINYTKPKNYMALLEKIEIIVNEHFKSK